ncbi:hypothetical protein DFP72DRAFT_1067747 [Ephemerocybe angulata]|uniref:SUN domain-containing protein n=1 Tax=Ephemerocybe angulata TaxID=980116 RepID=A0A8H6M7Z7_9AGAR|nr:hypothetical protein DFP72DRAFT_1067747 [Tulosesus angulatus]
MSFAGTPLGQERRLDRNTFLGRPNLNGNRPPSPRRIPASFSTGATPGPPKPTSSTDDPDATENEPALARFARQKQREAALGGGTRAGQTNSPLNPTKWNVKDTTVNVASAFAQAANNTQMPPSFNPNNSWASSSRSTAPNRSTSVEYESQVNATLNKRLAAPNRFPGRGAASKPPSKNRSLQSVPDSEAEEQGPGGRAKSPFDTIVDAARIALTPATFYLRRLSQEPENQSQSFEQANGSHAGNDSSYNYEAEERFVEKQQRAKPKKGRISVDNQAWKPAMSDIEDSDEEEEPEKRQRRKKDLSISRGLTTLPTVAGGKTTKRRRPKGSKSNAGGDDGGVSDDDSRTNASVSMEASQLGRTDSRSRIEPFEQSGNDFSIDAVEQGLQTIPGEDESYIAVSKQAEQPPVQPAAPPKPRTRSRRGSRATTPSPRSPRFSVGALLGTILRYIITAARGVFVFFMQFLASILFLVGRVLGTAYDITVNRPLRWATSARPGAAKSLGKYILLGSTILAGWYALQSPSFTARLPSFPSSSSGTVYTPPSTPVGNIDELVQRLTRIEKALSDLSSENSKLKLRTEDTSKNYGDVLQRIGSVEGRISSEARRISDTESRARENIGRSVSAVKQEMETLHAQLEAQQRQAEKERVLQQQREKEREKELKEKEKEKEKEQQQHRPPADANDEEARARLRALEERVGTVEGGVKEALDIGKKLATAPPPAPPAAVPAAPAASQGAAWWNKILSKSNSKEGLRITTPDGQDVTGLISHLVDSAVSLTSKDTLAKPDFALHSAGGRVIPSLTSPTYEIRPSTLRGSVLGALTGNGYAVGHPPVTAIEPSLHAGRCWPMQGVRGQLGVALAMPVYVEEVSVDHVAREIAFDMRTAPREMEVWGLVEGQDNIERLRRWREERVAERRAEVEKEGGSVDAEWEEGEWKRMREGYPESLPRNPEYVRLARFVYDIHAPRHVQTFKVDEGVREMGIDFGVVVGRVLSNWGHESYTCLYRLRVHGKRTGEVPPPYEEVEVGGEASA